MIQLEYSNVDDISEFFTIFVNNKEVARYHRYGDDWSKLDYSSIKWVSLESKINPIDIAKDMAKQDNCSLQLITNTSLGEIVSIIM